MKSKYDLEKISFCVLALLTGCAERAPPGSEALGYGVNPVLPEPEHALLPTVNIAPAKPRADASMPVVQRGFVVSALATGLQHPRWLYVLPNGDILVAESDAPAEHDQGSGIKGAVMRMVMKWAGAGVPSPDRILLLHQQPGKGTQQTVFLDNLHSPFGMALIGDQLYVANTDALMRYTWHVGSLHPESAGTKVIDLPAGPINHHWTKNLLASEDGKNLYITIGSNSNVMENGAAQEADRAQILQLDIGTKRTRSYATGLRNPNGMDWQPESHALWTAVNERDELGNNLVPDYMTAVKEGGFYGWPYSYYGQNIDTRAQPGRPDLVQLAIKPDYALGNHTASLGLVFYRGHTFPSRYQNGVFIGQHGSWNRTPRTGYKVVFIPFKAGQPDGLPEDFMTGFLSSEGNALGRPVGVAIDTTGALLVADDVGNTIWRVQFVGK